MRRRRRQACRHEAAGTQHRGTQAVEENEIHHTGPAQAESKGSGRHRL